MHNASLMLAGADIRAQQIDLVAHYNGRMHSAHFNNNQAGHQALSRCLTQHQGRLRIVIEATGLYSLDLALALHQHAHIDVMVANPRAIKKFAGARMRRSKTDQIDAQLICDFARRMPFEPWQPPEAEVFELRAIARRIAALVVERTREQNRLHAARASRASSTGVIHDIEVKLRHLQRRIKELEKQALRLVRAHDRLSQAFDHVTSVRGIASPYVALPEPARCNCCRSF